MAGLDVDWADRKRKAATRDPRERVVPVFEQICEKGRFGQKTGRGFYIYRDGQRLPDPEVTALVEAASAARGITRRKVAPEEIQQRVHAATVNEAAKVLADGIAARPGDIDVVLVHGYGYPAWRGGPMHEADEIGLRDILHRVEALHEASGLGWEPAPLLVEMAATGKKFADLNR
jgi:3-hydroxyacyl-CoA dehydrogenase